MDKTCPITKTLTYLSKKWTLIILRELNTNGGHGFNELQRAIEDIIPRTLSKRMKELEKMEIVSKTKFNEVPPRVEYKLTAKGKDLIRCFEYLDSWAKK
ncbi:helix-turn-helix transcriptional regulator [Candidatus Micrarchaeota archaeon]|nr:helix-turn-helix transcriptional regulator [Candidatus Micrarchaeota archaeon]